MKLKLTDALVAKAALPAGVTDMVLWDSDVSGFGLRIRPAGKTWILAYRPAGAGRRACTKKMKLATLGAVAKVVAARTLAQVELGRIASGSDPLAVRAQNRVSERARLGDLLDRYDRHLERRQYVNRKDVLTMLRSRMALLLNRDVSTITGAEFAKITDAIREKGLHGAASHFRTLCRAFLTWCVTEAKVLTVNPLAGHRKERATRADRIAKEEKGRALSDAELAKVWFAARPDTTIGRLIRFYMLTGCRRGEGAGLTWAMLNRAAHVFELPPVFVKQGRGHKVPVTAQLQGLLDDCHRDGRSDLVFPSIRTGGPMSGWTKLVASLTKASGVDFTLHDLRRTFRTGLSRLGVDVDTAELALGHARADLEAIYNRDEAADRLRSAFVAWADHVSSLCAQHDGSRMAA
jgi:integrase